MNAVSELRAASLRGRVQAMNTWLLEHQRAIRLELEVRPPTDKRRFVFYRLIIFARRGNHAEGSIGVDLGHFHEASNALDTLRTVWLAENLIEKSPGAD